MSNPMTPEMLNELHTLVSEAVSIPPTILRVAVDEIERLKAVNADLLAACKEAFEHATADTNARLDIFQLKQLQAAIAKTEEN